MSKTSNSNFKLNVKRTWKYVRTSKFSLVAYILISILEAVISMIVPLVSAKLILSLTSGIMDQLIYTAIAVFFINVIGATISTSKGFVYQRIYRKTINSMQIALAREILNLEVQEIDKNTSGVFIDRINKDVGDIAGLFMDYAYYITYIISNIGVLVTIFILNRYLFVYAIVTSLVIFFIERINISKQYSINKELKKISEKKTGLTGEVIRGIRDIKVLNATDTMLKQTSDVIEEVTKEYLHLMTVKRLFSLLERNISHLMSLGFILIGVWLYNLELLTIPVFIILYNYQPKVRSLLSDVIKIAELNKQFELSSERVFEVIEGDNFKKEEFGNLDVTKLTGDIRFNNVTFGYDKTNILKKINFTIKPNERVAFVGKSGAGKTTLFSLITRLYKVNKGEILLDGININDLTRRSIRDNMSIITQSPYIFNFTIKENLLLAKENATMKEIREACKLACIDDYIMSLPDKYETKVGENGVILSGGQKQRLAIARALLMKTEIILFDEATSALDNETQSKIQEAINNLQGEYTILIVAHRLSTVIDSDRIFVVDDGKIIDSGTHKELLKKCEYYKNLYTKDLEK